MNVGDFQTTLCPNCGAQCIATALSAGKMTAEDFKDTPKKPPEDSDSKTGSDQPQKKRVYRDRSDDTDPGLSTREINLGELALDAKPIPHAPTVSPLPPPATVTYKMFKALFRPGKVFADLAARPHPFGRLIFWSLLFFTGSGLMTWIAHLLLPLPLPLPHALGLLGTYGLIVPLYFALILRLHGRREQAATWFFMFLALHVLFIFGTRILILPAYFNASLFMALIPFSCLLAWETGIWYFALTKGLDFNAKESILLILPQLLGVPLLLTFTYQYFHGIR
jgi:hypothetical protein